MTELTQKLTKSMPKQHVLWVVYKKENTLCKKLGGGHLLEGGLFLGAYDITHHEKVATVQTRMSSERIVKEYLHVYLMSNKSKSWAPENNP